MEHQTLAQVISITAQKHLGSLAAPVWVSKTFGPVLGRYGSVEQFVDTYDIPWTQAARCQGDRQKEVCLGRFQDLNDFFGRNVAPRYRQIASPRNDSILVSQATCRLTAFDGFRDSSVWVKGKKWSLDNLLGRPSHGRNMCVCIFRLAPEDYHRVHVPCRCMITGVKSIPGTLLSVDPKLVTSTTDVLTSNARQVIDMWSPDIAPFVTVMVGAAIVGDIQITAPHNVMLAKGQEFGRYGFGGSTNVMIMPAKKVKLANRLVRSSAKGIETKVRVGEQIGQFL